MNETTNATPPKADPPGQVTQVQGDVTQDTQIRRIYNDPHETHRDTSGAEVLCTSLPETVSPTIVSPERLARRERGEWFAKFVSKPFGEYVAQAWQYNHQEREDDDLSDWHSELFWFTWLLRGHAEMQPHLNHPKKALAIIENHLRGWTRSCQQSGKSPPEGFCNADAWEEWFGVPKADAQAEFIDVWQKVRFLPGQSPLQQAVDTARRIRILPSKEVMDRRPVGDDKCETDYVFFLSIAGHLQTIVGDRTIMLPCAQIAEFMHVSKMTISRYRSWAQDDEYLKLAKPHRFRSQGGGEATEFRFDVSRWKCLSQKAQRGREELGGWS